MKIIFETARYRATSWDVDGIPMFTVHDLKKGVVVTFDDMAARGVEVAFEVIRESYPGISWKGFKMAERICRGLIDRAEPAPPTRIQAKSAK